MQEGNEFGSHPRLMRQRSLSAADPPHCRMCCLGGGRRGKSLAEFEFDALFRDCRGFFNNGRRAHTEGGNIDNIEYGGTDDADGNSDDNDELYYKAPSRWRLFCRRVKAEARRNVRRHSVAPRFHYDALSYAMNFDDGTALMQDEGGVAQLRLHSTRFSGPVAAVLPPTVPVPA